MEYWETYGLPFAPAKRNKRDWSNCSLMFNGEEMFNGSYGLCNWKKKQLLRNKNYRKYKNKFNIINQKRIINNEKIR